MLEEHGLTLLESEMQEIERIVLKEYYNDTLESLATAMLENAEKKQNYSKRDFMDAMIIFFNVFSNKLYDYSLAQGHEQADMLNNAETSGRELHQLILQYTGLDTHKVEEFL